LVEIDLKEQEDYEKKQNTIKIVGELTKFSIMPP